MSGPRLQERHSPALSPIARTMSWLLLRVLGADLWREEYHPDEGVEMIDLFTAHIF